MHVFIAVAAVDATTHILYGVCSESYTIGGDSRLYLRGRRISKNMLLSVDSRRRFEQVRKRLGNIIGGVNTRPADSELWRKFRAFWRLYPTSRPEP